MRGESRSASSKDEYEGEVGDQVQPLFSEIQFRASMVAEATGEDARFTNASPDVDRSESISKKYPWLICVGIVLLVVGISVLSTGLFVGITQSRSNKLAGNEDMHQGSGEDHHDEIGDKGKLIKGVNHSVGVIRDGYFESLDDQPFQVKMPIFGTSSTPTYKNCETLEADLKNALNLIANDVILRHAENDSFHNYYDYPTMMEFDINDHSNNQGKGEDSYDTNNQVKGVDEADIIKSNGDLVFAAYGSSLVVWDAIKGEMQSVTNFKQQKKSGLRRIVSDAIGLRIRGLLIHENRLAVIVEGYFSNSGRSILIGRGRTKVHLFDLSKIPKNGTELYLLASKEILGIYKDARLVGDIVHIISETSIDTYYHLTRHMMRGQDRYEKLNGTEYKDKVVSYATRAKLIPSFVERIMNELEFKNGTCENILRMEILSKTDQEVSVPSVGSIMNGYIEVTSFNILGGHRDSNFEAKYVASFVPAGQGHGTIVYASADNLVMARRGHEYDAIRSSWVPNTFLLLFSLEDSLLGGVQVQGAAQIQGYIMNQYSLDIWGEHLRIASSIDAIWGCNPNDIDKKLEVGACRWEIVHDSTNYLHILKFSKTDANSSTLERVGYLDTIGELGEKIESVRFMENKGWIVTFFRTDPLYSIDLSNHTSPRIMGELKVTGYSNYLHPYDIDHKFLMGIGQDADKNGKAIGLQISLYDVSDLSKIFLIHRYSFVGNDENKLGSSSQAQYDPKAFRFLMGSKKMIIPTSIRDSYSGSTYDGFHVYDISITDGITNSFNVSHMDKKSSNKKCWKGAYIPPRSLVHSNILLYS